jgi:hypothetical protein
MTNSSDGDDSPEGGSAAITALAEAVIGALYLASSLLRLYRLRKPEGRFSAIAKSGVNAIA